MPSDLQVELVSKELNNFLGIALFFRDYAPGTLTGGALTKVYSQPASVHGAQYKKNRPDPPKVI